MQPAQIITQRQNSRFVIALSALFRSRKNRFQCSGVSRGFSLGMTPTVGTAASKNQTFLGGRP